MKHYSGRSAFKTKASLEKAILIRLISNCVKIMKQKFFAIVLLYQNSTAAFKDSLS